MKSFFENITEDEFQTLELIMQNPGRTPASFFFIDPTIDGRIEELEKHGLIRLDATAQMTITELGRSDRLYRCIITDMANKIIAIPCTIWKTIKYRIFFYTLLDLRSLFSGLFFYPLQISA